MNLKEYIESGKLEAYVLGGLDASEAREVERFAREFPEIAQELNKLQISLEKYSQSLAVTPKADVKRKLMEAIDNDYRQGGVVPMWYKAAVAASAVLIVTLAATTFYYKGKWQDSEGKLVALQEDNAVMAQQTTYQRQTLDDYRTYVALVSDTGVSRVVMKGTKVSPGSMAFVYWNKNTQEIFLDANTLPSLAEDQQYQLWAIVDGKPVDAGVYTSGSTVPMQKMKLAVANAQAFAITLEPKGGSASPTLEAMYVMGRPS